jgi:hypothetical protein
MFRFVKGATLGCSTGVQPALRPLYAPTGRLVKLSGLTSLSKGTKPLARTQSMQQSCASPPFRPIVIGVGWSSEAQMHPVSMQDTPCRQIGLKQAVRFLLEKASILADALAGARKPPRQGIALQARPEKLQLTLPTSTPGPNERGKRSATLKIR